MVLNFSKVLVTGGAGFIGSHIVDRLLDEGINVRVLDNLSTGDKKNISHHKNKKGFQFIQGDIRNFSQVKKAIKGIEAVVHQAALVSVTRSVEDPIISNEINVKGTLNLLKASIDANVKRFVFASSCAVYGDTKTLPNKEDSIPKPLSPYAADKLAAENYATVFNKIYGLETVSLRYYNVYGPRQKYGPYSGVISIFINNILQNNPLTIFGNGEQQRDFVNVKDVIEANLFALTKKEAVGNVFNVGTAKPTTINKIAEIIKKITNKKSVKTVHAKPKQGNIKQSYADITKIQKSLGYKPNIQIEEGLNELIKWYSNQ